MKLPAAMLKLNWLKLTVYIGVAGLYVTLALIVVLDINAHAKLAMALSIPFAVFVACATFEILLGGLRK